MRLQIQEFWHELEVATNEKQQQMVGTINQHLSSLARDIEDVVGRTLDLRLEPVDIRMDPPTAQDFHDSLQQLFSSGPCPDARPRSYAIELSSFRRCLLMPVHCPACMMAVIKLSSQRRRPAIRGSLRRVWLTPGMRNGPLHE